LVNVDFVLKLWLVDVPSYSNVFVFYLCLFTLVDSLSGPLWMLVEAEGNIRTYQIAGGVSGILVLPVTYACYKLGFPPYCGVLVHVVQLFLFMIWRLFYLKKRVSFPVAEYCRQVYLRILIILPPAILLPCLVGHFFSGWTRFLLSCSVSCVVLAALYLGIGLSSDERASMMRAFKKKVCKGCSA
jgi:hypothetical protein